MARGTWSDDRGGSLRVADVPIRYNGPMTAKTTGHSTAIADVVDGRIATVSGTVQGLGTPLTAPISGRACVYFEVRSAMAAPDAPALEVGAQDFLIEDESGRALVVMERYTTTVASRAWRQVVSAIDADIHEVSRKLRQLKQRMRRASPAEQRLLAGELRDDKRLATLLCAMRAHARGRLHMAESLDEQRDYIAEQSQFYRDRGITREVTSRFLERNDVVLQAGDVVRVTGHCQWEPDPDPNAVGGYRDRAMRLSVRAPPDTPLSVEAEGERAAIAKQLQAARARELPDVAHREAVRRGWLFAILMTAAATALYFL